MLQYWVFAVDAVAFVLESVLGRWAIGCYFFLAIGQHDFAVHTLMDIDSR